MAGEGDTTQPCSAWHERCLKCSMCGQNMIEKCYSRRERLYCCADFQRLFSEKCPCCGEIIRQGDSVMRTPRGPAYHTQCFRCVSCGVLMTTGEMFSMNEQAGWLYCSQHTIDAGSPMHTHHLNSNGEVTPVDGYSLNSLGHWSDDGADPNRSRSEKRPRTVLSAAQRRVLKHAFEHDPKPSKKARHMMALETGLSIRVVQVWFQNQRAKVKKKDYKDDGKKSPTMEREGGTNLYSDEKDSSSRLSATEMDIVDDRPLSDHSSLSDSDTYADVNYQSASTYFQFPSAAEDQLEDHTILYRPASQNFPQFCF